MTSPTANTLIAIDPGPEMSAWITMRFDGTVAFHGHDKNELVLSYVGKKVHHLVIEDIRCYGMAVGQETFDTCKWMGRFWQANGGQAVFIPRLAVRVHICKRANASDSNVRQALIDRYGGSKDRAIGTKKKQGPLYGIKKHVWSALAVGVTFLET